MDRLRGWAGRWGKIFLIALLVQTPLLLILDGLLDGFSVGAADGALALAFVASLLLTMTYPFSLRFSFRFRPLVFLIVNFVVTVLVFRLAIWIVESIGFADVVVNGFWTTVLLVICLLFAQSLAGMLLTSSDDLGYYAAIQTGLRFRHRHKQVSSTDSGVIFMEIDGLAKPIFEEAMANGFMPTLKRWLDSGTYQVSAWEPDLSSQTSASQAGILLGSNEEIPAFRWWNKETGQPEVSSSSDVASALELRLSTGTGLLEGGASRWNVFSGDA